MWYANLSDTEDTASEMMQMDHRFQIIDQKQIRILEPNLKIIPSKAIFAMNEGSINPVSTTVLLFQAAREAGANIQLNNEVTAFVFNGSKITGVSTKYGNFYFDLVVVAAGIGSVDLFELLGIILPINKSPSILMKINTNGQFVNRIVSNPSMEIRAASKNLLLAAEDYIDESIENCPEAIAFRTLQKIREHWRCADEIKLNDLLVGWRPIPKDGAPIIGHLKDAPGLYVSVMHPGVTLAAVGGRLIADEILTGQDTEQLNNYRFSRFG